MHRISNDLSKAVRKATCEHLSILLADAIDLHYQVKQAHWNVKGPSFIALHELFDKIAEDSDEYADLLAERIAQLGGQVHGTVRVAAAESRLKEYPLQASDQKDHIKALSAVLAAFGAAIRAGIEEFGKIGDADAADICTQISRGVDKYLWFVESHAL